ncbi:hypothetical protein MCOR25_007040 [Pyricularia grisea]|nr:hypothetical protein MCOR25_007040 [Pyricularia grisea]
MNLEASLTASDPDPASAAGEWLISLCSKVRSHYNQTLQLAALEKEKFDDVFELYHSDPAFNRCHVQTLRVSLSGPYYSDYKLARKLLDKDLTGRLLANENNILQKAIRSAKVSSDQLGRPRTESCPELFPIVELLVAHGVSADCVNADGASALSCACVLGCMSLFRYFVDLGADLTTEYPRARHGNEVDNGTRINLLQVTLHVFVSPQNIVDNTWDSGPPGISYEIWGDFDADQTWGVIGSVEMGQLLRLHNVTLDSVEVQKLAVYLGNLGVLRWCVNEYGPRLPSDPRAWGHVAERSLSHLAIAKYLVSEYPGLKIDRTFITGGPWSKKSDPDLIESNWLPLAIFRSRLDFILLFLDAGTDPTCPGLQEDAITALRRDWTGRSTRHDEIEKRLQIIKLVEGRISGGDSWAPPTLAQLKQCTARAEAKQKLAWDQRITRLIDPSYPYIPLTGKSSFRLLDILPSSDPMAPVACRLRHSDIIFQPDYEALSYVWGAEPPAQSITIDGHEVPIRANLVSALLRLRVADKIRTLWIDVLCIDQCTFCERNQQFSIMGDIFKCARQIIVWLGEETTDSRLAFSWIREIEHDQTAPFAPGLGANKKPPTYAQKSALRALLKLPWFFRIWVIQEIGLSRAAIVMCGGDSAKWTSLLAATDRHVQEHHPFVGFDSHVHVAQFDKIRRGYPKLNTLNLLQFSSRCQMSEVKDRIYGLLGLFEPGFIPVDYSLPLERIFIQFTGAAIRSDDSLDILKIVNNSSRQCQSGLPSWVPNYTSPRTIGVLPGTMWLHPEFAFMRGTYRSYTLRTADGAESTVVLEDFPTRTLPGLEFRDSRTVLVPRGKLIDTTGTVGPPLPNEPNFMPGAAGFADVLKTWESLAVTVKDGFSGRVAGMWEQKRAGQTKFPTAATAVYAYTLAAITGWTLHSIPVGFAQWYRHCGQGVLESLDPSGFLHKVEFYLWWRGLGREDYDDDSRGTGDGGVGNSGLPSVDEDIDFHLERYADPFERACYGRCFFTTEGGTMGLGVPGAQTGDRIAFIPGGDWPLLLRPCGGDDGDAAEWTLVGDCYLYGLDPFGLFEDVEHIVEEFLIR